MRKIVNPFIVTGKIDPAYFCDREEESARLIRSLDNGNNLVIISPRRMGKTGLIQFCYEKPEWKKTYYTFFIDILHTSSLREFTYTLGKEIYETLLPRSKRMTQLFMQTLKSISGKFGFDPLSNIGKTIKYVLNEQERDEYLATLSPNTKYDIARMKGLGEMDAEELNETTMDIHKRVLRQITVEDALAADETFSKLMGEEVGPRREFIETNATYVENLDI